MREVHPEVCFWALNTSAGGERSPMQYGKKVREGERERLRLLKRYLAHASDIFKGLAKGFHSSQVAEDDILDALAAAVTGWLPAVGKGTLATLPANPIEDSCGLPMEMVYCNLKAQDSA